MDLIRTFALLVATLATTAIAAAGASTPAGPGTAEDEDKLVLRNDHVTVWLQGKKPSLHVFPTAPAQAEGAAVQAGYAYDLLRVVEYRDLDGDGAPSAGEIVARLDLQRAASYEIARAEDADSARLLLTLRAPVTLGALADHDLALPQREANVTLSFSIRAAQAVADRVPVALDVPATSIETGLAVEAWPWVDAEHDRLALETRVAGALDALLDEPAGRAAVLRDNLTVGHLAWAGEAAGETGAGESVDVAVATRVLAEGNATRLVFTYDAPRLARLAHAMAVGVPPAAPLEPGATETPDLLRAVPGPAAALVVAASAAAVALRRR